MPNSFAILPKNSQKTTDGHSRNTSHGLLKIQRKLGTHAFRDIPPLTLKKKFDENESTQKISN
jgi:hypothetical protein